MSKLGWYKRNPSKFFAGTVGLTWDVKAVYGLVLDLIYDAQGLLPDDGPRIVHYLGVGMSLQRWKRIREELVERGKLVVVDGHLTNPAASLLLKTHAIIPEIISGESETNVAQTGEIIGKQIGKQKKPVSGPRPAENNDLTLFPTSGGAMLPARAHESQSQSQTRRLGDADVIAQVEELARVLGQPRGKYWETDYRRMLDEGLTPEDILAAAKAHTGGPVRSMNALRGLARHKQGERERTGGATASAPVFDPATMGDRDWGPYLAIFLKQGIWDEDRFGPPPSRLGCLVPAPILAPVVKAWAKQGAHPREERDLSGNIVAYPSDQPDPLRRAMWEPRR